MLALVADMTRELMTIGRMINRVHVKISTIPVIIRNMGTLFNLYALVLLGASIMLLNY